MQFKNWMKGKQPTRVAAEAGLTTPTIYRAMAGLRLSYDSAKKLSRLTGGKVTLIQLAEGEQANEST